jgi:hypothetical protein
MALESSKFLATKRLDPLGYGYRHPALPDLWYTPTLLDPRILAGGPGARCNFDFTLHR